MNNAVTTQTADTSPTPPPRLSAIAAMASRLQVSQQRLHDTLWATAFKDCQTDEEFTAALIVANEYRLNPLTKEIYAFKTKGGGITPIVSVDGWIRIMNEHPSFDGIEFEDLVSDGKIVAIEAIIYRKDRSKPIRVTEYMDECKGTSDAWKKTPKRMLRHRALMQCCRIAFGFSGIYMEGDQDLLNITPESENFGQVIPSGESPAAGPIVDAETGEIDDDRDPQTGMTQVDEQTARNLDSEQDQPAELESFPSLFARLEERLKNAANDDAIVQVELEFDPLLESYSATDQDQANAAFAAARDRVRKAKEEKK